MRTIYLHKTPSPFDIHPSVSARDRLARVKEAIITSGVRILTPIISCCLNHNLSGASCLGPILSSTSSIIMLKYSKSSMMINSNLEKSSSLQSLSSGDQSPSSSVSSSPVSSPPTSPIRSSYSKDTMIRVWLDEMNGSYRTVMINEMTSSRDVINRLVSRMKVKCADPKLHKLQMQVTVMGRVKSVKLEDNTRLVDIIACNPWDNYKIILVEDQKVLIRIWDSISEDVVFRSLFVSKDCNVQTVLEMIHKFYQETDISLLSLCETSDLLGFSRQLNNEEVLFRILDSWSEDSQFRLVLKLKKRESTFSSMKKFMYTLIDEDDSCNDSLDIDTSVMSSFSLSDNSDDLSEVSSVNSDSFFYVPFDFQ